MTRNGGKGCQYANKSDQHNLNTQVQSKEDIKPSSFPDSGIEVEQISLKIIIDDPYQVFLNINIIRNLSKQR